MNKMIKVATIVACAATMLVIVGCGKEQTPAEKADKQIAELFALVTDCGGVIPQAIKDELAQSPDAGKIEAAEKLAKVFTKLKEYGALVKETNLLCAKLKEKPLVKSDEMLDEFMELADHPKKIDGKIKEFRDGLEWLKTAAAEKR